MERYTEWLDEETKTEVTIVHYNMRDAMVRLGVYEDTGLTPEQIREIDKLYAEKCRELAEVKQQAIAQCFMSIRYENPGMKNDWCAGLRTVDGEGEPCEVCKRCYMQHEHWERAGLGKLRRLKVWND